MKIDGEFIRNLPASRTDQSLLEAIIAMAHGLGKQTIAEHVQDDATVEILRRIGVDHAQGLSLRRGRPLPIEPNRFRAPERTTSREQTMTSAAQADDQKRLACGPEVRRSPQRGSLRGRE